ncbi:MAG TPA: 1-phosphofructokinase [Egibacteraceae bacterium]|nr:1-phosphofructokinase [Egibacteraceae bacterium]
MIVTVTANPSLDRTIEVGALTRGAVHRASAFREEAGGKGVNIARALAANGHKTRAVLPCGGSDGRLLTGLLADAGIDFATVPIGAAVRTNVSVVEDDGTVTKLNTAGPALQGAEVDGLVATAVDAAGSATWAVCSGSLPPGVPDDLYARLVEALRAVGCAVAVDTSGPALTTALAARPDVVKPNAEELAEAVGAPLATLGDAVAAAQELRRRGARAVLASLGADGALLVDDGGAVHGEAPVAVVRSAVGAGDATLAGFLAGGGHGRAALADALTWGAAAVGLPGTRMPGPGDLDRAAVRVHDRLDPHRPLDLGATP